MIKLTLLTLAGLFGVMMLFGEPGARSVTPAAAQTAEAAPEAAAPEPAAEIIAVAAQTPEKVQNFAGPALRPSPEHAGEQPAPAAPLPAAAAEGAAILYVTGNKVNFRAGPSKDDAVVGALLGGSPVEAIGPTDGGWVHIRDAQGREGFMSANFLSANRPG